MFPGAHLTLQDLVSSLTAHENGGAGASTRNTSGKQLWVFGGQSLSSEQRQWREHGRSPRTGRGASF